MKNRVGVYVRVSEERQLGNYSPKAQRDGGIAFAESMGWSYSIYEEAKSGTEMLARKELARMFDYIEAGKVHVAWAKEQTRISRSVEDSASIRKLLLKHKCRLFIDSTEIDLSDLSSSFMYSIQSAVSEYEAGRIAERMTRGRKASFDNGRRIKSRMFGYGYTWADGKRKWIVHPEQAAIVKQVFGWWINGTNITMIKKKTNTLLRSIGRPNTTERDLWRMMRRLEYVGKTRDASGEVIGSAVYPAIVDQTTFDQAQVLIANYKNKEQAVQMRRSKDELSGVLRCGECGQIYKYRHQERKYQSRRDGTKVSIYPRGVYYHAFHLERGICSSHPRIIYQKYLLPMMRTLFVAEFTNSETIEAWKKIKLKEAEEQAGVDTAARRNVQAQLAKIEKQKKNMLDAIAEGVVEKDIAKAKMNEIAEDELQCRELLASLISGLIERRRQLEDNFAVMMESIAAYAHATPQGRRVIYRKLLKEATLTNGQLHLHWLNDSIYDIDVKHPPKWLADQIETNYWEYVMEKASDRQYEGKQDWQVEEKKDRQDSQEAAGGKTRKASAKADHRHGKSDQRKKAVNQDNTRRAGVHRSSTSKDAGKRKQGRG